MKKLLLISAFALSLPITSFAAPTKSNTTMAVNYENPQQLIKNYYASQEFCQSSTKENDPETDIMCSYRDAASTKLNQLGYCFGDNDEQSMAEREWKKCSQQPKKIKSTATTTAQTTAVSEAVINEALTDTNKFFCNNKDNFTQRRLDYGSHILSCYMDSDSHPEQKQKCILEDLSFWVFDQNMRAASTIYSQNYPSDKVFFSAVDFNSRVQEYIIPRFGSLPEALNYFDPGITKVTGIILNCMNQK